MYHPDSPDESTHTSRSLGYAPTLSVSIQKYFRMSLNTENLCHAAMPQHSSETPRYSSNAHRTQANVTGRDVEDSDSDVLMEPYVPGSLDASESSSPQTTPATLDDPFPHVLSQDRYSAPLPDVPIL